MSPKIIDFIATTLDIILIYYFLIRMFGWKNKNLIKSIIIVFGGITINVMIIHNFGAVNIFSFFLQFIIYIIIYTMLLNEQVYKILFGTIMAVISMLVTELIVINLMIILFKLSPPLLLELNMCRVFAILISKAFFVGSVLIIPDKLKPIVNFQFKKATPLIFIGSFNIIIVYITFLLYKHVEFGSTKGYAYITTAGIGSIAFSWVIYKITKDVMYQSQKENIWKIREEEFYKSDFYLKNLVEILDSIKSQKHELNNYLSTLYGLIYLESYTEAKSYIKNINARINNMNSIVETNHPIVTALASIKKNKAIEEGIIVEFNIDIPEDVVFDTVDFSIIIGNLLDNAIEACSILDEEFIRKINLKVEVIENNLILDIVNSKSKDIIVDTKKIYGRFTTKEDMYNHGLGLGNINFIVKESKGKMEVEDLGDEFSVSIVLPIQRIQENLTLEVI